VSNCQSGGIAGDGEPHQAFEQEATGLGVAFEVEEVENLGVGLCYGVVVSVSVSIAGRTAGVLWTGK